MSTEKNTIFTDEFLTNLAKEINAQYGYKDEMPEVDPTAVSRKEEE